MSLSSFFFVLRRFENNNPWEFIDGEFIVALDVLFGVLHTRRRDRHTHTQKKASIHDHRIYPGASPSR